jgi:hypothetical protein
MEDTLRGAPQRECRGYCVNSRIDCLLSPQLRAQASGRKTAEALLAKGWRMRQGTEWSQPGDATNPTDQLPIVRLVPPGEDQWFLELLSSPEEGQQTGRRFQRLETDFGHFALCSFRFLALAELDPLPTDSGLKIARPEMMAAIRGLACFHARFAPGVGRPLALPARRCAADALRPKPGCVVARTVLPKPAAPSRFSQGTGDPEGRQSGGPQQPAHPTIRRAAGRQGTASSLPLAGPYLHS